eukprot:TRINITY_DN1433_c0_g1_i1.p1 TRINITY_DN1433_c0_g1~~TRINITY_DN1433_c0_g1_i1.p1  ORF type:complete len:111 (+),score=4.93 TRINITY_DN1433_c0_g1_i1:154-486(+)
MARRKLSAQVNECVTRWVSDTVQQAEAGDLPSMVLVAEYLVGGYGFERNIPAAREWLGRAAKRHFRPALAMVSYLSQCYLRIRPFLPPLSLCVCECVRLSSNATSHADLI